MNVEKILDTLEIIKDKGELGLLTFSEPYYYDEEFTTDVKELTKEVKERDLYKRTMPTWICYSLDPNYPTSREEYVEYSVFSNLVRITGLGEFTCSYMCGSQDITQIINMIKKTIILEAPSIELIRNMHRL